MLLVFSFQFDQKFSSKSCFLKSLFETQPVCGIVFVFCMFVNIYVNKKNVSLFLLNFSLVFLIKNVHCMLTSFNIIPTETPTHKTLGGEPCVKSLECVLFFR